jgi:hypothetical protein
MSDILAQLGKEGKRILKYISQQTEILESSGTKNSNSTSCYICNRTSPDPNRRQIENPEIYLPADRDIGE